MKYTSAEANKLLKALETRRNSLLSIEEKSSNFVISVGENVEEVRPEYDFHSIQDELAELNGKIRTVQHAINVFNTTHTVPGFDDMTIDQVLIYLPQLSSQVEKLRRMAEALPRERKENFRSNLVEYNIANYDPKEAAAEYERAQAELSSLQLALDAANAGEMMELEIAL
jgi:hypothetical protein